MDEPGSLQHAMSEQQKAEKWGPAECLEYSVCLGSLLAGIASCILG